MRRGGSTGSGGLASRWGRTGAMMVICQRGAPDLRSLSPVVLVMAERCTKIDEPCAFRAATAPWFRQVRFPQIAEAVWSGTVRTADLPLFRKLRLRWSRHHPAPRMRSAWDISA